MNGHPCETCLRWPECNGVDWGSCPASVAQAEKENAPTAMAEFLTKELHIHGVTVQNLVPPVYIPAEELLDAMKHGARIRGRILP